MKVEVLEKAEGILVVRYTAETPLEAMLMSTIDPAKGNAPSVRIAGGTGGMAGYVSIDGLTFDIISALGAKHPSLEGERIK